MVHCAHFKVLAHILGSFHYSLHNPHNVYMIHYFLWEYSVWPLFYLSERPALNTLMWGFGCSRETRWRKFLDFVRMCVLTKLSKVKTTRCQMVIMVMCLMNCWQFIKLCYIPSHPATFSEHPSQCFAVQHTSITYPHSWMADLFTSCLKVHKALCNQKMKKRRGKKREKCEKISTPTRHTDENLSSCASMLFTACSWSETQFLTFLCEKWHETVLLQSSYEAPSVTFLTFPFCGSFVVIPLE